MKFVLNKQTGTFVLKEDILDRISRQAKAEVSSDIAGEKASAVAKAQLFLNSIDRVRDNYLEQLYNKKQTDKPSYLTMIPLLVDKATSDTLISNIKKSIDQINVQCKPFFTDIKNKKQVNYNALINALQNDLKSKTGRLVVKEAWVSISEYIPEEDIRDGDISKFLNNRNKIYLNNEVITQSIIKNYIAFLINETLLKDLSDEDKKNVFNGEENFKNFQQIFSKMLMPTDDENKVYQDTLEKYNIVKDKLRTKSPEEAKQENDEKSRQEEEAKKKDIKNKYEKIQSIKKQFEDDKVTIIDFLNKSGDEVDKTLEYFKTMSEFFANDRKILRSIYKGDGTVNKNFDLEKWYKDRVDFYNRYLTKNSEKIKEFLNKNINISESKILKEYREEINNLLIPHMQKQLGFDHPPIINFAEDSENAQDMFGKTAYYNPSTSEITVYVTNRHPKDIMRSVAHEIVHHAQNQRGEFENSFNLGEEGYAQNNSHLRSMEEEAYLSGNMIFRDWEDNFKKQRNQNKMINESSLRAKIRSMIKEEMYNHTENEPAKKHDADCGCDECANKKRFLEDHGVKNIAESVEKEIMPLKEWRNMELNSLLLNRFGIVSPQVLGEKKNKKPDADGDGVPDWADEKPNDPKVGAKKSKPAKKGKVPPQFLKKGKKDESK
jgi:hypothetical protein